MARRYPERAALLQAGVLGENLSTRGWTEESVCIGDPFRIGTALVQLSQPRRLLPPTTPVGLSWTCQRAHPRYAFGHFF